MNEAKNKRPRLSVDLEPFPEIQEMLELAKEATGFSVSKLVIEALRSQLPKVIEDLITKREAAEARFRERVGKVLNPNLGHQRSTSNNPAAAPNVVVRPFDHPEAEQYLHGVRPGVEPAPLPAKSPSTTDRRRRLPHQK
jgi:hypothetical protein